MQLADDNDESNFQDFDDSLSMGDYNYHNTYHEEDDDFLEEEEQSAVPSQKHNNKHNKRKIEALLSVDKGFGIIPGRLGQSPVAYFRTQSVPGATIRNAVTGVYETGYKFGSHDELLFFKTSVGKDSHILFYDGPEQFEKHMYCKLSDDLKQAWSDRSMKMKERIEQ